MTNENRNYLKMPDKESCYEYLLACYERISADVGDYAAFVNVDCTTMMSDFIVDVEKLAAYIASNGFKKGDVLTIFLPTSAHAFTIFYALSKLGVIANFVHPLTPLNALKEMLAVTQSKGIFILDKFCEKFSPIIKDTFTVVCRTSDYTYGDIHDKLLKQEEENFIIPDFDTVNMFKDAINNSLEPVETLKDLYKDTAIYLHGSGTTGKSKIVKLSSLALNYNAYGQYQNDIYHEYGNSYSLCVLPCFHSFGVSTGIHYCLCNAYSCVIMPKFDAHKANENIRKYKIQYISGAPSMFEKMMNADNFINDGLKNLTCLYSGGDIVSEAFLDKFNSVLKENGSRGVLYRGWGLTEMCGACTKNSHLGCKKDSVGLPIPGMRIKIIDEDNNVLPVNTNGEIAITCKSIMNGYLPSEDVDFTGLYPDEEGTDWVHTGDMGYLDEEGYLFFTGRKKRIIVISAYNIYPYSIEQKIRELPYVKEACAVQGYDENSKPLVKLCLSLFETDMTEDEIREDVLNFCKENLDHFAVPRKIVFLDELPRTKLAKLDFLSMSDPVPVSK